MVVMEEFKHFVIVKFKEGVEVEDLTKGMEKLVSEIDVVKSFEWYFYAFKNNIIYFISYMNNHLSRKKYKNKHLRFYASSFYLALIRLLDMYFQLRF